MLKLYARQIQSGRRRFLLLTNDDLKKPKSACLVVDVNNATVQRIRDLPTFLRLSSWKPIAPGDPTLDQLVQLVPALRPYRGIEVRLTNGTTAWICWGQWTSESQTTRETLERTTRALVVPRYEPDADYFLATEAMTLLGGQVLDPPRSSLSLTDDAY